MHFASFLLVGGLLASNAIAAAAPAFAGEAFPETQLQSKETSKRSFFGCSLACDFLNVIFRGKVSYPQSPIYNFESSRYWSQQQASSLPVCRVSPTSAFEVSITLLLLQTQACKFAVKSGGHAAFAGGSNIDNGVTIDLRNLNDIKISQDQKQTSIGAGARWFDVYTELQSMGLAVVGGRVADIGVGGLTLGGGISFFSAQYGWACDNVNNFEVVFADGIIRNVNPTSYPDLFFALRGGGNNFGIVTRFNVVTFPQGGMWGGAAVHFIESAPALNKAFEDFNINVPSDPQAGLILAYAYAASADLFLVVGDYQYAKPVVAPPIFENFTAITPFQSTLRLTNLTDLTVELNNSNPGGFRQTYWTFTIQNSAPLMNSLIDIFISEVTPIKTVPGIVPSYVFQPISTAMTSQFSKNGGNAFGISPADGPLNIINIAISWSAAADDVVVLQAARNMVDRGVAVAREMGLDYPFLYQNYAAFEQEVFESYGTANLERLRVVKGRHDPRDVFGRLQPGYFKLP